MRSGILKILSLKKKLAMFVLLFFLFSGAIVFFVNRHSFDAQTSSELGIATVSPSGESGGLVIPASCPSDLHDDPNYGQQCIVSTACSTQSGTYQCGGNCSITSSSEIFTVPTGVTSITIKAWGAGGGGGGPYGAGGGAGGYATTSIPVTPREQLAIITGGGGGKSNGGYNGGGGGGGSAVKRGVTPLVVAAGGGGNSGSGGGAGGGQTGTSGSVGLSGCSSATGGTQSAPGNGSVCQRRNGANGSGNNGGNAGNGGGGLGGFGNGNGGEGGNAPGDSGGGGGGGGYYGGGGGGTGDGGRSSGGAGGSSYVSSGGTTLAGSGTTPPNTNDPDYVSGIGTGGDILQNGGNGRVVILYDISGNTARINFSYGVPSLPANYGAPCTSPANSCGMTSAGTIGCSNICSAITPPESLCTPPVCYPDCSQANYVCAGQTFNDANGCGTNNCTGTRTCDYNWKEVAP